MVLYLVGQEWKVSPRARNASVHHCPVVLLMPAGLKAGNVPLGDQLHAAKAITTTTTPLTVPMVLQQQFNSIHAKKHSCKQDSKMGNPSWFYFKANNMHDN